MDTKKPETTKTRRTHRYRTGCIYSEEQRNLGKGRAQTGRGCSYHYLKGVGKVTSQRRRWVGEIMYYGKRYRFRSTDLRNVQAWLNEMKQRFND